MAIYFLNNENFAQVAVMEKLYHNVEKHNIKFVKCQQRLALDNFKIPLLLTFLFIMLYSPLSGF